MANLAPYGVKDMASGEPFVEGTYRVRINKFTFNAGPDDEDWKKAHPDSKAEAAFLVAELIVQDELDSSGTMVLGRRLWPTLTFKRGKDYLLRQLIEACGKDEDWMLIDEHGEPHWDDLKDAELHAVITVSKERVDPATQRKYDARNDVKKFISLLG